MSASTVRHPWRTFLRFSVRGLIVFIFVIGLWLGLLVRSAHIQRDAVAGIINANGQVKYNWEWSDGRAKIGGKPWAPRWLIDQIGIDYFGHVKVASLPGDSDAACAHIGRLPRLEQLTLGGSAASDAGLAHLKGLTKLSELDLRATKVTDAGLANLEGLTSLTFIDLSNTPVSDAGLAHLKGLVHLKDLELNETGVTDAGLAHMTGLMDLSILGLLRTKVSDAGLFYLQGLPNLARVNLRYTQMTDAGITHLKSMAKLEYVGLGDKVTEAGVSALRTAKPNLEMDY